MTAELESSIIVLALTTFVIGMILGIISTKFIEMMMMKKTKPEAPKEASPPN